MPHSNEAQRSLFLRRLLFLPVFLARSLLPRGRLLFQLIERLLQLRLLLAQLTNFLPQVANFRRHQRRLLIEFRQRPLRRSGEHRIGLVRGNRREQRPRGWVVQFASIPMRGRAESLNVAMAAGILMYAITHR